MSGLEVEVVVVVVVVNKGRISKEVGRQARQVSEVEEEVRVCRDQSNEVMAMREIA